MKGRHHHLPRSSAPRRSSLQRAAILALAMGCNDGLQTAQSTGFAPDAAELEQVAAEPAAEGAAADNAGPDASATSGGEDATPPPPRRMCDGSSDFRLILRGPRGLSLGPGPGLFLLYENGARFLYLRGDCRYWVLANTVWPGFGETREGVLEPNAEAQLHDDLRYDEWPELAGVYAPERPPTDGAPPDVLTDLTNETRCLDCASLPDPKAAAVGAMFSAAWDWASALHQQGSPLTGPVRALAVEGSSVNSPYTGQIVPWTVDVPLSSLVVERSALWPGLGRLVAQPDAEVLRGWRNNQLAEMFHPAINGPFIAVSDNGGPFFALYVRDTLPFEGDNGVVPF